MLLWVLTWILIGREWNSRFDAAAQTYFYQRYPACSRRELRDDRDFRWIVDFDSDYLYGKHLPGSSHLQTKPDVYSPVLRVTSGLFYTLHKTGSTFLARSDDNYKAFDRQGAPEYLLHLLQSNPGQNSPCYDKFKKMDDAEKEDSEKRINDESPCSAAGYGGKTDGLLPPT